MSIRLNQFSNNLKYMPSLKLNHKLLIFWFSSILISMLLIAVVFYFLQNDLRQEKNKQRISDAFSSLQKYISDNQQRISRNALLLTKEGNIISSLSLIHKYQNINDYQAIVFDEEKKKINKELVKLLKTTSAKMVSAYDGYNRLTSFVYTDSDNNIKQAIQSYSSGEKNLIFAGEKDSNYKEMLNLAEDVKYSINDIYALNKQMYIDIHNNELIFEMNTPVIRKLKNEDLRVGTISVIKALDNNLAREIQSLTGMDVLFSIDGRTWISSFKNAPDINKLVTLSDWQALPDGLEKRKIINGKAGLYGIAKYKISDPGLKIKFAFIPATDSDLSIFPLLQKSLAIVFLVNLLILLPVGIYFLKKNVLLPVKQLVKGVEAVNKGQYENLNTVLGSGELAYLANSFNEMAYSIKIREDELINLSLAVEQSPLSLMITDVESNIEYVNEAFCSSTGYKKDEVIGKKTNIIKGGEASPETYSQLWSTISQGKKWQGVLHNKTKQGKLIWESVTILPIKSPDGEIIRYLGINEDISVDKKNKERLALQSTALQAAVDAIVITDPDGNIEWVNPAYETLTGYSFSEAHGNNPRILNSGKQDREFYTELWDTILAGKTWKGELYNKRKNGEIYLEEESITPVFDNKNKITNFVAIKRDITQQRKQEKELQQSQKMDALGKLTGGVAHDYNNMLGIVIGYSDLLKEKLPPDSKLLKYVEAISLAGDRGASLTKKLLTFSRQKSGNLRAININDSLNENVLMLEKTLTARIKIVLQLEEHLCDVYLDDNDLNDAVLNMSINAMHAMPSGGQLTISTVSVTLNEFESSELELTKGDYVLLSLKDTGTGMDNITQQQVFEPFFSTKGDKGTGLGMSQVYGFVKGMNGAITVDSKLGHGTQFNIYLPCYQEKNENDNLVSSETKKDLTGTENILVVDDEVDLEALTREILQDKGYNVLSAHSAKQALEVLSEHKVDLVLSDIIMPETDGFQLALEIKDLYPKIKVQLISGYNDVDNEDLKRHGFSAPLKKPIVAEELLEQIKNILKGE